MGKFAEFVPDHIRALNAYVPGKMIRQVEAETGKTAIKLASNENPFGPSPLALEAMKAVMPTLHLYPDPNATDLRAKLAERHGLAPENLVVTAGSTPMLEIIARTVLGPGLNAISSERTFIVYPLATRLAGAEYRQVEMKGDGYDLDAIANQIDENTRLIYIANPNNPTGTLIPPAELDSFLDRLPSHVLIVLDEAYYDFADSFARKRGVEYSHSVDYVKQERNVIVLRTFSKALGLAALRVGYAMGPAELMDYFARVRTVFMVSSLAEAAALAGLDDAAHREKTLRNNAEQAEWLSGQLREMGYQPVETWANFIYCEVGEDSVALANRLQSEGVIIRPLNGGWGARTAIRVTIGTPEQNRLFVSAFRKVTSATPVR